MPVDIGLICVGRYSFLLRGINKLLTALFEIKPVWKKLGNFVELLRGVAEQFLPLRGVWSNDATQPLLALPVESFALNFINLNG